MTPQPCDCSSTIRTLKFDELVSSNTFEEIAIDEKPLPPGVGELRTCKEQEVLLRRYKSGDPSVRGEIERIEIE